MKHYRFLKAASGIYVPSYKELIAPSFKLGLKAFFTVELLDAKSMRVIRKLAFQNLITDAGLNGMAVTTITALTQYCAVGTGNTAPANGDTTLVAEVASGGRTNNNGGISDVSSYVAGTPDYARYVTTRLFSETQGNGNLTEIGFFNSLTGGTMFSRQLFKDGTGTPTTLTKDSSHLLRVTYEIRAYPPVNDVVTAGADISGTPVDVTARPVGVGSSIWTNFASSTGVLPSGYAANGVQSTANQIALVARTATPTHDTFSTSGTVSAYTAGSFVLNRQEIWDTTAANFTILSVYFDDSNAPAYGLGFNPGLAKNNNFKFTLNYQLAWGRQP